MARPLQPVETDLSARSALFVEGGAPVSVSRTVIASTLRIWITLAVVSALGSGMVARAGELPDVREVLDRFVEAVGGRAVLEQAPVQHYQGTIVQDLSWKEPPYQETGFVAEADAEGRLRYAESSSWFHLPAGDDGEVRRKLRWIMHPRFALVVEEFFPDLQVRGREVRDGRPMIVLVPADLPAEHYALYFDERTGLLAHVGYHNDLEDWRLAEGVLFPRKWVFGRKGGHVTYVFEEVSTGPAPIAR